MLLRNEMVNRSFVRRLNLRVAFHRLAVSEITDRIVAVERDAFLVQEDERLASRAIPRDETRPVRVCLLDVAFEVGVPLVPRLLVVLQNQLAVDDLKPLRADGGKTVNARRVAAVTA